MIISDYKGKGGTSREGRISTELPDETEGCHGQGGRGFGQGRGKMTEEKEHIEINDAVEKKSPHIHLYFETAFPANFGKRTFIFVRNPFRFGPMFEISMKSCFFFLFTTFYFVFMHLKCFLYLAGSFLGVLFRL